MTIHKEGYVTLTVTAIALFFINMLASRLFHTQEVFFYTLIGISTLFFLIVLQFFRHPRVNIQFDEKAVLAPADGKVVVIEETEEGEYFKDKRIQVSIFMSPFNVHVNRTPVAGNIQYFKYHPGKYLVAWHPKSSTENERTTVVIQRGSEQILLRQIAGALARRICWYIKEGQQVKQGEEFGFIKFGSRVDIFLPLGTKIDVQLNQVTQGGVTRIATLN